MNNAWIDVAQRVIEANASRTLTGVDQWVARSRALGDVCARCGRELADGEEVYADDVPTSAMTIYGDRIKWRALVCSSCCGGVDDHSWMWPWAQYCPTCRRVVHYKTKHSRIGVCSDRCARPVEAKRKRQLRADARRWRSSTNCDECGERFVPSRTDARYCSGACRQKAYRHRTQAV